MGKETCVLAVTGPVLECLLILITSLRLPGDQQNSPKQVTQTTYQKCAGPSGDLPSHGDMGVSQYSTPLELSLHCCLLCH